MKLNGENILSESRIVLPLVLGVFLLLAYLVTPFRAADYVIFCIFVLGFDLLYGHMGKLSFGHMLYLGTGAYFGLFLGNFLGHNPLSILFFGFLSAFLLGLLIAFIAVRTSEAAFALINLAFNQVGYFLILVPLSPWTRGEDGISVSALNIGPIDLSIPIHRFFFFLGFLLLVLYVLSKLINSPFGLLIHAIRDNELRASFLGYDTLYFQWINFGISAGIAGLAGAMFGLNYGYVTPSFIDPHRNVEVVFASLIGGSGNLLGAVFGGIVYMLISNFIADIVVRWEAFLGVILLLLVFRFPKGILGFISRFSRERNHT